MNATGGGVPTPPSPDWGRILDAALGPQPVEAAGDAELRAGADIALEHLAVIAHLLDDARHPVLGQPELLAVSAFGPDQPLDLGLLRLQGVVDGLARHAQLLGIEHGKL